MTKEQAIYLMQQGKKITHENFDDNEWITMQDNNIVTEEGYSVPSIKFWSYRENEWWDKGYSIFIKK